jgi:hypothetical protein
VRGPGGLREIGWIEVEVLDPLDSLEDAAREDADEPAVLDHGHAFYG